MSETMQLFEGMRLAEAGIQLAELNIEMTEQQKVQIVPIIQRAARAWINETHRNHKAPRGDFFRTSIRINGHLQAVGMAGRPGARMLEDGTTVEILRIASVAEPTVNACTRLYARLIRAGRALGYIRFITYTLPSEPGTSLRAAGFDYAGMTDGGEWDRPSRKRKPTEQPTPKCRWVVPSLDSGLWPKDWSKR